MGFLLGKNEPSTEGYLEGSDLWIDDVFVRACIDVFILCDFEGNEIGGDHISNDFHLRHAVGHHFAN